MTWGGIFCATWAVNHLFTVLIPKRKKEWAAMGYNMGYTDEALIRRFPF